MEKRKADHNSLDLKGLNIGHLTVIERTKERSGTVIMWRCKCNACGKDDYLVRSYILGMGKIKSCGCMTKSILSAYRTIHGMTDTPTWNTWKSMIERCENKNHKNYKDYGLRGISVCDRWKDFINFYADMGNRLKWTTIDRIDVNGNYEPLNCRWATAKTQSNNKRNNVIIKFNNEEKTLAQWAEKIGVKYCTLHRRLKKGFPIERALMSGDLRQRGMDIKSSVKKVKNRFGEECRVALYKLG